ncbi:MAG: hypothetical protein ABIQ51_09465 [Mesorhizobium sp.]
MDQRAWCGHSDSLPAVNPKKNQPDPLNPVRTNLFGETQLAHSPIKRLIHPANIGLQ